MKKTIYFLLLLMVFAAGAVAQSDDSKSKAGKLTAEEIIAKHQASVGTPGQIGKAKSRVMVGSSAVTSRGGYVGKLTGPAQLASEGNMIVLAMVFNSNDYPYEKVGYDGKDLTFGRHTRAPSLLTNFLRTNKVAVKRGLFGGVLNASWPLLSKQKGVELDYLGEVEEDGQRMHKVKFFSSDIGALTVLLYFDVNDYHHLRTEYKFTASGLMTYSPSSTTMTPKSAAPDHFTLTEKFSNFAKAGDLVLPLNYVVEVSSKTAHESLTWSVNFTEVYYNEALDASAFKVS
jgi:hypothetical protein